MIDLVLDACREAGIQRPIVVLSPAQPAVIGHVGERAEVVLQTEQRGTGHAVSMVPAERLQGDVLILNADSPLISAATIAHLVELHRELGAAATITSINIPGRRDGRIVRDSTGRLDRIVEERDATPAERQITEINVGLYCFRGEDLGPALAALTPENQAGEYYLTDVFASLRPVEVVQLADQAEAIGVNDRVQLAEAEGALRQRIIRAHQLNGVTFIDPATTFVEAAVTIGQDTLIEPFTILRGATEIGADCRIGPYAQIQSSTIGDGCRVENSWLDRVTMGSGSDCGPFAKLRPGTEIAANVHVGSFAEIVRSKIGEGSKVPHVSYLGDATVGRNVNVGAGTITANFDGVTKNPTVIEDDVFVGVGTMLRSPVKLGKGSRTGAGSVVTRDVPPGMTAVGVPARALRRRTEEEK